MSPASPARATMSIEIQQPERKNQYRATGIVKGRYQPGTDNPNRGELVTADGAFPASIRHPWWKPPEGEQIFNCWVKTVKDTGLMFVLKGLYRDAEGIWVSPDQLEGDTFSIRGNLQWWNEEDGNLAITISPNFDATRKFKPFFIEIQGHVPKPRKGSFWEIEATREGDKLVLIDGREVFPPQKKRKPGKGKGKGKDKSEHKPKPQAKQKSTQQASPA